MTKIIPQNAVKETEQQIATYRRFRDQVHALVETSEKLCDARLRRSGSAAEEAAEKRGSKQTSKTKSSRKSKFS